MVKIYTFCVPFLLFSLGVLTVKPNFKMLGSIRKMVMNTCCLDIAIIGNYINSIYHFVQYSHFLGNFLKTTVTKARNGR